jgi:hypothetical protein
VIHGQDLDCSRANAEQARQKARDPHDAEARGNVLCDVGPGAIFSGVISTQAKLFGQRIWRVGRDIMLTAKATPCRVKKGDAKNNADGAGGNASGEVGTCHGAESGCHLKKHSDAHIGKAFPDVRDSGTGRSGDHRNEGSTDGVTKIDVEEQGEHGDDDHATTQTGERTDESGKCRGKQHCTGKFDQTHLDGLSSSGREDHFTTNVVVEHRIIDVHQLYVVPFRGVLGFILQPRLGSHQGDFSRVADVPL